MLIGAPDPIEMPFASERNDLGLFGQEGAVHLETVDTVDVGVLPFGKGLGAARGGGQQKQEGEKNRFSHVCVFCIQI